MKAFTNSSPNMRLIMIRMFNKKCKVKLMNYSNSWRAWRLLILIRSRILVRMTVIYLIKRSSIIINPKRNISYNKGILKIKISRMKLSMRKMLRLERDTISIAFLRALEPVFGTSTKMYLYSISIYLTSKIIIWNKSKL